MKRVFITFVYSFIVMSIISAVEANAGPRDSNRASSYVQLRDLAGEMTGLEKGLASHYSKNQAVACPGFKKFNPTEMTAAHKNLPCGSRVRVYNPQTKQSVVVMITDRGPFVEGRIIDLSTASFKAIGNPGQGVLKVQLEVVPKTTALGPVPAPASSAAAGL